MSIIGAIRKLVLPATFGGQAGPAVPQAASLPVSRRTFFSFFGVGVAMLAKPDLFLTAPARFIVPAGQGNALVISPLVAAGLRAEFARAYAKLYRQNLEKSTFMRLMENCSNIPFTEAEKASDDLFAYYQREVEKS